MNYFSKPPGVVGRWADGVITGFAGITCFIAYWLVEHDLCGNQDCQRLVYTKFWASVPELFILYGISLMVVGIFLVHEKRTNRLFRFGLVLSALLGVVLSTIAVFGIATELGGMEGQ